MLRPLLAATALLVSWPALAGGYDCGGDCYRQAYVPPTYGTVTERYLVQAPRTYAIATPAQYGTVYERVMVSPGGRSWSVTRDAYGNKVGCWVVTPAQYATVPRTVMTQAPQVTPYAEPAQYGFRSHTVQTSPGFRSWVPLGPSYSRASYGHGPGYGAGPDYGARPSYGAGPGYRARPGYGTARGPGSTTGFGPGDDE